MTPHRRFLLQAALLMANACILAFVHTNTALTAALLLPLLALSWATSTPALRRLTLLAIPMGLMGEIWAVHWQVWTYNHFDILGIPLYIGLAWGLMATFLASLHEVLKERTT